jgi:membrane protease YdiL (CAAX protease family)
VKRFWESEAAAAVMWVIASLVFAAFMAPWLYQLGKWFGEVAATEDLPKALEALGAACQRAEFARFFSRSLLISALGLLPFLIWRIRNLSKGKTIGMMNLQTTTWQPALMQVLSGYLIGGGILWGLTLVLDGLGAFIPDPKAPSFGKLMGKVLMPSLVAPFIEEWLFRGLLLGLWLRAARPLTACLGTSLVFAFLHFLAPPEGYLITSPQTPWAGFQLLGVILFHFAEPRFFITDFATLFVVGMILAWTRVVTGSLWLAIGLHAGWIFSFKCATIYYDAAQYHWLRPWGVGENVRSGLLPMISLLLTAAVCHVAMKRFQKSHLTAHDGQHEDSFKPSLP